jgi:hypothetical protein
LKEEKSGTATETAVPAAAQQRHERNIFNFSIGTGKEEFVAPV